MNFTIKAAKGSSPVDKSAFLTTCLKPYRKNYSAINGGAWSLYGGAVLSGDS
jgi:hypothetical protein